MMILILVGGVCCLCVLSSGGLGLMYAINEDFKNWLNGLFGGGGKISDKAGTWVCPDVDTGSAAYDMVQEGTAYWCKHPDSFDSSKKATNPSDIQNHFRASQLPPKAIKGKKYDYDTIKTEDGGGQYGPSLTKSYQPKNAYFFTA